MYGNRKPFQKLEKVWLITDYILYDYFPKGILYENPAPMLPTL